MSFLTRKISRKAEELFGKSDLYTNTFVVYLYCGIMPLGKKHVGEGKSLFFVRFMQGFQIALALYCLVAFIIVAYQLRHDMEKFALNLSYTVFVYVTAIRVCILLMRQREFEDVLDALNNNLYQDHVGKSKADQEILNGGLNEFHSISKLSAYISVIGNFFKIVSKVLDRATIMPVPNVDVSDPTMYKILFAWDVLGVCYIVFVFTFHDINIVGVFVRIQCQYLILANKIPEVGHVCSKSSGDWLKYPKYWSEEVLEKRRQEKMFQCLRRNITHHQEILKIIKRVNRMFQESILINIFGAGSLLVIMYFHMILIPKNNTWTFIFCQTVYAVGVLLVIVIECFCGSQIQTASHAAANALYSNPWLEMDTKNRKIVKFFQMCLWKEPAINAGSIFSLNLRFFASFMQSIYSYMTFVRNTISRR